MGRREMFKLLGLLGLGSSARLGFLCAKSGHTECHNYNFDCYSLIHPDKTYQSTDEFWNDHYDKKASELNRLFQKMNLITSHKVELLPDGKTVRVQKVFKSKHFSDLYTQAWKRLSQGHPVEYTKVGYKNYSG
jgi:hypothetical protein